MERFSLIGITFALLIVIIIAAAYILQDKTTTSAENQLATFMFDNEYTQEAYRGDNSNSHFSPGLGNVLARIVYKYLCNKRDGVNYDYSASAYNAKEWDGLKGLEEIFPDMKTNVKFSQKQSMPHLNNNKDIYKGYPHEIRFFQPHRNEIIEFMGTKSITKNDKYDVVVHVRLDDVEGYNFMSPLPRSWYKSVFSSMKGYEKSKVLIICRKPHKDFLIKSLEAAKQGIREGGGGTACIDIQHGIIALDFNTMLSAPVLVLAASTFSFWGAFLSPRASHVHVPFFGVMSDDESVAAVKSSQWKSTKEQQIHIHRLRNGFKAIRNEHDLNL